MKSPPLLPCALFALLIVCAPARAALDVLSCEAEWAALAAELGGERVRTASATIGTQDPHRIEARPSLIAKVRNADLLVCTGLELEAGWLPILLQQSGNPRIQPGQPGHLVAGFLVPRLEMPTRIDRSRGDVHGSGNPHIQLNPHNIAIVAKALSERLAALDPEGAPTYEQRYQDFAARWTAAVEGWEQRGATLAGVGVISHHKDMVYLIDWLGMRELGTLEPKPGLEPSSAHLAALLRQLQQAPARMVLRTPYQNERASAWLADKAGVPAVMLPNTVGGTEAASDLFALFDDILARLLGAMK